MAILFDPVFPTDREGPLLMAGPCSAETREQTLLTARQLCAHADVIRTDLFRAGIWKPRTMPGAFEGVGAEGLSWLSEVAAETGLRPVTEVANAQHVEACLAAGLDTFWIGARTSANPFSVQEIADALTPVAHRVSVIVKNPVNPDLKLWIGAIERIRNAGVRRIAALHRGFSSYGDSRYRNTPRWQIAIDLMQTYPELEVLCDVSHICGRRDILAETAQKALDLNFRGLMVETHPDPDKAWSDAAQQITPAQLADMFAGLVKRKPTADNPSFLTEMENRRFEIDEIDEELLHLIARRMQLVREIGILKRQNNVTVLQPERFRSLRESLLRRGIQNELSPEFIHLMLEAVHQESINQQERVMNPVRRPV